MSELKRDWWEIIFVLTFVGIPPILCWAFIWWILEQIRTGG